MFGFLNPSRSKSARLASMIENDLKMVSFAYADKMLNSEIIRQQVRIRSRLERDLDQILEKLRRHDPDFDDYFGTVALTAVNTSMAELRESRARGDKHSYNWTLIYWGYWSAWAGSGKAKQLDDRRAAQRLVLAAERNAHYLGLVEKHREMLQLIYSL